MESKKMESGPDREAAARLELLHLERQFRMMKNDVEVCPAEMRRAIGKQKKIIKGLEMEKEDVLTSLKCFDGKHYLDEHRKVSSEVLLHLLENKKLEEEIGGFKHDLNDLNVQIDIVSAKIDTIIREQGGAGLIAETIMKQEKYNDKLENRLHTEVVKCNEQMMLNAQYGRQVEDLLKEKGRFQKCFEALSKDLVAGNKIICDLIEQSSYIYEQRREAELKLNAVKTNAKLEVVKKCKEARHFERNVLHRTKLNVFLTDKCKKRDTASVEEEKMLKKEETVREMEDFLKKYGRIVIELRERFSEKNLDRLVMQFMKLDEDNYNMYTFINDLNKKLDHMRGEISQLQNEILNQRSENQKQKIEQTIVIENLEKDIAIKRCEIEAAQKAFDIAKTHIDSILDGISNLFFGVDCSDAEIIRKLGQKRQVEPENVLMYLKVLERRFKELKIVYQNLKHSSDGKSYRSFSSADCRAIGFKTELPETPCPLCAEKRDISEVDESFAVPADIEECRQLVFEEMKKGFRNEFVHSVANCPLPKSRRIVQKQKGL